jgi:hypothetical protein
MRFMALEINLLLDNISPILKDDEPKIRKQLQIIINKMDNRDLFIKDYYSNGELSRIEVQPLLEQFILTLSKIKADIIMKIGNLLYLPESEEKDW